MEPQTLICYRLNPNQQELDGEVSFEKNIDGRIFSGCTLKIMDHSAVLTDERGIIKAVLSLNHFYLINSI